jgi:gluconate 2-dehydrogenase gamma chain
MVDRRTGQPLVPMSAKARRAMTRAQVSRRAFIAASGGAGSLVAQAAAAQGNPSASPMASPVATPPLPPMAENPWPNIAGPPDTPSQPIPIGFQALTEQEAAVIEALTARILPGTPDDPGAREAGVVYYIDFVLANNEGINESVYLAGPYAQAYEGDEPPDDVEGVIWVDAEDISRYGYQSALTPLQIFQQGVAVVEEHARQNLGGGFADLDESDQDEIIWSLLRDEIEGFDANMTGPSFFLTLRRYTSEGMFSDPAYGGNRDMVGWTLVGFPGAQRAYAPEEMLMEEAPPREPQSIHSMPHFNPGVNETETEDGNPVLPVRGTEDYEEGE